MNTQTRRNPDLALAVALCSTLLGVSACSTTGAVTKQDSRAASSAPVATANKPASLYPSTYKVVDAAPTLIRNATLLTGTGERLDGADLLLRDGKVA
ncbi:MAG: hypothetical protein FJ184_17705, partial [Gammaproteobacteria bacterium]|nr:hypothetical protein [Gammaproteobacteria bacterium]